MFNIPNKPTTGNGVSSNDCKEYMMSLERELGNLLKCKPTMKGMKNMGMNFTIIIYYIRNLLNNTFIHFRGKH